MGSGRVPTQNLEQWFLPTLKDAFVVEFIHLLVKTILVLGLKENKLVPFSFLFTKESSRRR